jgi:hypothetical protein
VPNQAITLHNSENDAEAVASLGDDSKALGFYGVRNFQCLKVWKLIHKMLVAVNFETGWYRSQTRILQLHSQDS